jgi:hypothetical protein
MVGLGVLVNDELDRKSAWLWSTSNLMEQLENQYLVTPEKSVFVRLDSRSLKIYSPKGDAASATITYDACEPGAVGPEQYYYCLHLNHGGDGPNLLLSSGPHESNG